jgi:TonB family protein
MRKYLLFLTAVVTTLFGPPALSKERSIVVTATPTRAEWAQQLGTRLSDAVRYPRPMFGSPPDSGFAQVVFIADASGQPSDIRLVRSSRSRDLDRAALAAVGQLKSMLPRPTDVSDRQRVRANILFAASEGEHARQMRLMRAEAATRTARSMLDKDTLVLNVMSGGSQARTR